MIVTYILRNQKQYPKYKEIAFSLGRILKDGTGDHAICIYYKKIADQLISIGHIEFKGKIEKVLYTKNSFVEENKQVDTFLRGVF